MIFVTANNEPTMMLMLCNADLDKMRDGRTLYVDETATEGFKFSKVVLSLHKTNEEAIDLLRLAGTDVSQQSIPEPQPKAGETRCKGCRGITPEHTLYEGQCIICWANQAKGLEAARV